jgi:pimeloyl-ACP methyl ester carboxylesterase
VSTRLQISGPDGRALDVELSGPDRGPAVVFHPGTPDSGTLFERLVTTGAERGLRHIAYSRPGYGLSERHRGRRVADCVQDVAAILDGLGIDRAYIVGQSGGGPHALACAALLPERTIAAATLGGVAPWRAEGLDWLAGMGDENLEEFGAAEAGEEPLLQVLEPAREQLLGTTGEQLAAALGDLVSEPDRAALTGEYGEHLARSIKRGLRDSVWGWFDDDRAFVTDWGFDLGAIARPVTIWQGREDRFVPFAHGEWLAGHVHGAHPQLRDGEGHLSIVIGRYGEILDDLTAGTE